jgi:DNA-binding transcriptional LysR family regulator
MRPRNIDLNLFVVFDAIYDEQNLTRAAKVLHVTQPAVSNALRRLRDLFNDQLFTRTPRGVSPTPVANAISGEIKQALHLLGLSLTEADAFEPGKSERTYTLSVHDYHEATLIPRLVEQIARSAPGISIESYSIPRSELEHELAAGNLDFALDVPLIGAPQLCRHRIASERYVCVVRNGHPASKGTFTLENYLELDHIHLSSRRRGIGHIDLALERLGRRRRIRVSMKNYLAGPQLVASSDMALTIPRTLAGLYELTVLELPFIVDSLEHYLYWHKSADRDRAITWMRETILGLLKSRG